jgi:hypothetical protein
MGGGPSRADHVRAHRPSHSLDNAPGLGFGQPSATPKDYDAFVAQIATFGILSVEMASECNLEWRMRPTSPQQAPVSSGHGL